MYSQAQKAEAAYQDFRIHDALDAALAISNRGNLYMEEIAPWSAFKKVRLLCWAGWFYHHSHPAE